MATRKTAVPPPKVPLKLLVSREEAREKLNDRLEKGKVLAQTQQGSFDDAKNAFKKWDAYNSELLKQLFTNEDLTIEYNRHHAIISMSAFGSPGSFQHEEMIAHRETWTKKINVLDSIIERLEIIPVDQENISINGEREAITPKPVSSSKVFVVHGHDERAKVNLEIFLREIGLDPIVLHRQADEGLTIIEKFEKHSEVGYAFILLTPDEIAYPSANDSLDDASRKKELRARPNVIFEFGYFVGKLGRSKVCCLHTGNVSLPSDVAGMIYKSYSSSVEEAAYSITKDLKAAGYILK